MVSSGFQFIYIFIPIDYIRTFTWDKKLETIAKNILGGQGRLLFNDYLFVIIIRESRGPEVTCWT